MTRILSRSISDFLVPWTERPWPLAWADEFGREAPLVLEIGFGNGEFLRDQALEHSARNHVGIEVSWASVTRLFRRLEQAELTNVRVLQSDAEVALGELFETASLDEVFINHPCPWPKDRHEKRRILDAGFTALLADRMRPGARVTIVTDHAEYAAWVARNLEAQNALRSCHPSTEVAEISGRKPTKYQRKAMAQGFPIHYFQWYRETVPVEVPPLPHTEASDFMPSLTLRGSFDIDRLFPAWEAHASREEHAGVAVVVRLVTAYRRLELPMWLVEVLVLEDKLRQEFGVLVLERPENQLLLKLSNLGRPHPTFGVKRAVWKIALWLRERHPSLELVHHNLGDAAD